VVLKLLGNENLPEGGRFPSEGIENFFESSESMKRWELFRKSEIKVGLFFEKAKKATGSIVSFLEGLGKAVKMTMEMTVYIFKGEISLKDTALQMVEVGWKSFPIIMVTSFFVGMVLALQMGTATISFFNEPVYLGMIISFCLIKELGPVLTAMVVSGSIGAAITAELGTMKINDQLDALYTLGTNPIRYLVVSRFLACFFMLPLLTVIANIVGIFGGMFIANYLWDVPSNIYFSEVLDFISLLTFLHGFIKSFFFAMVIAIVACHKGFNAKNGAGGVGIATTSSVIYSMVFILISDYFLTMLLTTLNVK